MLTLAVAVCYVLLWTALESASVIFSNQITQV